jgi:endonuclease/exonuclease/phosphatase (EEP) superfamily protein YafD
VRFLRWLSSAAAGIYLVAVLGYLLGLRVVGEDTWLTTLALYLPHGLLLAPVALFALLFATIGPRRMLLTQLATAALVIFPIMGLRLGGAASPSPGAPHLRLLSYNVDSGEMSVAEVVEQIVTARPDVVVLQETANEVEQAVRARLPGFATHRSGQFFLASRYAILAAPAPQPIDIDGVEHSAHYQGYTLDTPLGTIDLYNVHPISPREGAESVRGTGLIGQIESGAIFRGDRHEVVANTARRRAQVQAFADAAAAATHPVIIAGDTNLPGSSRILGALLGRWQDGFDSVGRGFGYTYPAHKRFAWMRIDRILTGPELRFIEIGVGDRHGSDHYCVWADIEGGDPRAPAARGP